MLLVSPRSTKKTLILTKRLTQQNFTGSEQSCCFSSTMVALPQRHKSHFAKIMEPWWVQPNEMTATKHEFHAEWASQDFCATFNVLKKREKKSHTHPFPTCHLTQSGSCFSSSTRWSSWKGSHFPSSRKCTAHKSDLDSQCGSPPPT